MAGSVAMMAAGAFGSAYGDVQSGQMTANSLDAQAQVQAADAKDAMSAGVYNSFRSNLNASQKEGTAVAAYGANGVAGGSGSETAVLQASASNAELDSLNIQHNAELKAINYDNQASLDQYGATSALQGAYWKAAGDLTQGLIKVGSNFGGSAGGNGASGSDDTGTMAAGGGEGASMGDAAAAV